jgi:hypothetical protein
MVKAVAFILYLSLLSILFACGELNTSLFSSEGTYQVRALVNGNSLESCSLIRQNDKIIPYFAVSVVNDPDLMGLLVYLQNSKGEIIGDRVLYTTDSSIAAVQSETQQEEINTEKTKPGDNESGDNDSAADGDKDSEGSGKNKRNRRADGRV